MDPGKKESILQEIRIANRLIELGKKELALQMIGIVIYRLKEAR